MKIQEKTEGKEGTALKKIANIAENLYKSTPELESSLPKSTLKVFKYHNPEAKVSNSFSLQSDSKPKPTQDSPPPFKSETFEELKIDPNLPKTISEKGLSAKDIQRMYNDLYNTLKKTEEFKNKVSDEIIKKQDRYIKREQEFRRTIEELQDEIKKTSSLDNPNIKKHVEVIKNYHSNIIDKIKKMQDITGKVIQKDEEDVISYFESQLFNIQKEIDEERVKKVDTSSDFKEREKGLNEHLEKITSIAQKIDHENEELLKKNAELDIEFKSQENDRTILLQSLINEKKKMEKLKDELEYCQKIANENNIVEPGDKLIEGEEKKINEDEENDQKKGKNSLKEENEILQKYDNEEQATLDQLEQKANALKKIIEGERNNLLQVKTMHAKNIERRIELEHILKKCVEDVKMEIAQKKIRK